jgi:pimeloyl-ACP methyl ester carboxylesterase
MFLESQGIKEAILIGHSLGTYVALEMAHLRPESTSRVILVDGTLLSADNILRNPWSSLERPALTAAVAAQFLGGVVPVRRGFASLIAQNRYIRQATLWPFVAHPGTVDPKILEDALSHNGGSAVLRVLTLVRHELPLEDLMRRVDVPVDLVWGDQDRLISVSDVERARGVMHVERAVALKNCGHWPMIEQPKSLSEFLLG